MHLEVYLDALIWSEIPNWQHISFDNQDVYAKDLVMLKEMIRRDRNKASSYPLAGLERDPKQLVELEFVVLDARASEAWLSKHVRNQPPGPPHIRAIVRAQAAHQGLFFNIDAICIGG
jgi:hypothetical protein